MQDENGGSVYIRLSTRSIDQPSRELTKDLQGQILKGGYWLKQPGSNPEIILAYQGVVAAEVIEATANLGEKFRDIGVLAITSSDILLSNWKDKHLSPNQNKTESHVENLLKDVPRDTKILTVIDGHQLTLSWLGSVLGHKVIPLGVDRFGQTGNIKELLTEFAIDSGNISNLGFKLA